MENWMMPLKNRSDLGQDLITCTQGRDRRNCEMSPRNQGQGQRRESAKDLRDQNDTLSAEPIRQVAGGQRQRDDGDGNNQANQPKRRRRMGACIHFPFHRHSEHQASGDRK
jgi:hypothetical protein